METGATVSTSTLIQDVASESYKGSTTYHYAKTESSAGLFDKTSSQETDMETTTGAIKSQTIQSAVVEDPLCSDVWLYCKFFTDFCTNTFWASWMKGVCYKTCGHCSGQKDKHIDIRIIIIIMFRFHLPGYSVVL